MADCIHHIAVQVSDAHHSADFYCKHLGFEPAGEFHFPERGRTIVFVQMQGIRLEFLQDAEFEGYQANPKMLGFKHLCLQTNDVDGDIARLKEAGVPITMEPFDTALNSRISFFEDPDGLPVELWQDLG